MNALLNKYRTALNSIPLEGSGVHRWLLGAANLGAINGFSAQEVLNDLCNAVPARRQLTRPSEIKQAVVKAFQEYTSDTSYNLKKG